MCEVGSCASECQCQSGLSWQSWAALRAEDSRGKGALPGPLLLPSVNLPGSFLLRRLFIAPASLLITSNSRADSPAGGQSPGWGQEFLHYFEEKGQGKRNVEGTDDQRASQRGGGEERERERKGDTHRKTLRDRKVKKSNSHLLPPPYSPTFLLS